MISVCDLIYIFELSTLFQCVGNSCVGLKADLCHITREIKKKKKDGENWKVHILKSQLLWVSCCSALSFYQTHPSGKRINLLHSNKKKSPQFQSHQKMKGNFFKKPVHLVKPKENDDVLFGNGHVRNLILHHPFRFALLRSVNQYKDAAFPLTCLWLYIGNNIHLFLSRHSSLLYGL